METDAAGGALVGFNPRAHEGRDVALKRSRSLMTRFNPRAHEGRDSHATTHSPRRPRFNPRAHEGRDAWAESAAMRAANVSIHAPTRGATCSATSTPSRT